MRPEIVFFDMDHTLLDLDCDVSWKEFLIEEGLADQSEREDKERFFQDYLKGILDEDRFQEFQLRQFRGRTPEEIDVLTEKHFRRCVLPQIYPAAREIIHSYKRQNIPGVLLTATNEAIAAPLVAHLKLDGMLATRLEVIDGRYTGAIVPPYCIAENKIHFAQEYAQSRNIELSQCAYFGDSINDVPMLKVVGQAFVVNPPEKLEKIANERGWPVHKWTLEPAKPE